MEGTNLYRPSFLGSRSGGNWTWTNRTGTTPLLLPFPTAAESLDDGRMEQPNCGSYDPVSFLRFSLIIFVATPLAVFGMFGNLKLFLNYIRWSRILHSPVIYLTVLALADAYVCAAYMSIFTLDVISAMFQAEFLHKTLNYSIIPLLTVYRITSLASAYIVIAATLERCFTIQQGPNNVNNNSNNDINNTNNQLKRNRGIPRNRKFPPAQLLISSSSTGTTSSSRRRSSTWLTCSHHLTAQWIWNRAGRLTTVSFLLIASFFIRIVTYWEFVLAHYPDCTDILGRIAVEMNGELISKRWHSLYSSYVIPVLTVFIPFPTLMCLNIVFIRRIRLSSQNILLQSGRNSHVLLSSKSSAMSSGPHLGGRSKTVLTINDTELLTNSNNNNSNDHSLDGDNTGTIFSANGDGKRSFENYPNVAANKVDTVYTAVRTNLMDNEKQINLIRADKTGNDDNASAFFFDTSGHIAVKQEAGQPPKSMAPMAAFNLASTMYKQRMDLRREEAARIKRAGWSLVGIVASYLVCNSLSLVVTFLEKVPGRPFLLYTDPETGMTMATSFYIVSTDVISFMFMLNSVIRLVITITFNHHANHAAAAPNGPSSSPSSPYSTNPHHSENNMEGKGSFVTVKKSKGKSSSPNKNFPQPHKESMIG